jgi:amino-acid N-acetyltransferase
MPMPLASATAVADTALVSSSAAAPHVALDATAHIRRATVDDVPAILALITANLAAGHLLPRTEDDVTRRATRFLVVEANAGVVGCAELAPLSRAVAEVRSLVVDESCRGRGFGSHIVEELQRWARQDGFSTLCAFTHHPSHFVRLGFSIVPHQWLPEKIATDCVGCPKFRRCTQYAMALSLRGSSLRTTPAGQRPYLALPPNAPGAPAEIGASHALTGRTLLPMATGAPRVQ